MTETPKKAKTPAKPKSSAQKKVAAEIGEVVEPVRAAAPAKPAAKAPKSGSVTEKATAAASNGPQKMPAKVPAAADATHAPAPSREQIAQLAHRFWKERGGHHGSHEQDWFRAEQELRGRAS